MSELQVNRKKTQVRTEHRVDDQQFNAFFRFLYNCKLPENSRFGKNNAATALNPYTNHSTNQANQCAMCVCFQAYLKRISSFFHCTHQIGVKTDWSWCLMLVCYYIFYESLPYFRWLAELNEEIKTILALLFPFFFFLLWFKKRINEEPNFMSAWR